MGRGKAGILHSWLGEHKGSGVGERGEHLTYLAGFDFATIITITLKSQL